MAIPTHQLKPLLKAIRASQPFNLLATAIARMLIKIAHGDPLFLSQHLPRSGLVGVTLPNGRNLRLWSRGDDGIANRIYWYGWRAHEPETTELFLRMAAKAHCTLDIGAHVGFFSLLAALANSKNSIYAFEPLPPVYDRLERNIKINSVDNVYSFQLAVGEKGGDADFFYGTTDIPSSSSLSLDFMTTFGDLQTATVKVIALDDFVCRHNISKVDLVKIDTETTEAQVLNGMDKTLKRDHPDIFCEVLEGWAVEDKLQSLLEPLGYNFYLLTDDGPQLQQKITAHPRWRNYLFSILPVSEVLIL